MMSLAALLTNYRIYCGVKRFTVFIHIKHPSGFLKPLGLLFLAKWLRLFAAWLFACILMVARHRVVPHLALVVS